MARPPVINNTPRPLKTLQPAPPRPQTPPQPYLQPPTTPTGGTTFLSLPAELRVEIYKLALRNVTLHIMPLPLTEPPRPHPLTLTSRQIRDEILPILYSSRPIRTKVTDLDFAGLLTWLSHIHPSAQTDLAKNANLSIKLVITGPLPGDLPTLRRWLHLRADMFRTQAWWKYEGRAPERRVWADLRRRVNRMKNEQGKRRELVRILDALGIAVGTPRVGGNRR